jgi:hypothetical protein
MCAHENSQSQLGDDDFSKAFRCKFLFFFERNPLTFTLLFPLFLFHVNCFFQSININDEYHVWIFARVKFRRSCFLINVKCMHAFEIGFDLCETFFNFFIYIQMSRRDASIFFFCYCCNEDCQKISLTKSFKYFCCFFFASLLFRIYGFWYKTNSLSVHKIISLFTLKCVLFRTFILICQKFILQRKKKKNGTDKKVAGRSFFFISTTGNVSQQETLFLIFEWICEIMRNFLPFTMNLLH